jgi:N-acyl-D-amino-acid deacylase
VGRVAAAGSRNRRVERLEGTIGAWGARGARGDTSGVVCVTAPVDILIEGGTVVDGTGAPGFPGAVVITGQTLRVLRGAAAAPEELPTLHAGRRIDARGHVVAPGFIDLHSHGGLTILAEPRHEPKVRQGVTTEVIGVDGNSYAPFRTQHDLDDFLTLNAGLDGRPEIAYDWRTVAEYLARFDRKVAVNIAYLIGNSALRIAVVGWDDVEATPAQMADQRALLREGMEEGAFGLSTGLDYPPGAYASTGELADLLTEAAKLGGFYHTHVRYPLGDGFLDPFREAIEIGRRGDGPVHITHFYHRATFPGTPEDMLRLVDDARAEGLDISFDLYPYEWASTRLLIMLPTWIQAGGVTRLRERLADRATRASIRDELAARGRLFAGDRTWAELRMGHFARPENARWEGRTLGEYVAETGFDPVDAICDLLLAEDLRINQVTPGPHRAGIPPFLAHPGALIGTDGVLIGAKPSPRTYGSFPRILGEFVREERLLSLESAVRKMTGAAAARLGLTDRGRLADGLKADVVVFDPLKVRALATYDDPCRFPAGIPYVIVNGELVIDGGEHTGALPGRALHHGRPT